MKHMIFLALLALLLAGCAGDIASPTDSHDRTQTTTTTTVETQTAELEQSNNKLVCVGLVNIGSCNAVQVNTQRTASNPVSAPASVTPTDAALDANLAMLCLGGAGIVGFFLLCMVLMSLFAPSYGD
jgi:hypothetical protein